MGVVAVYDVFSADYWNAEKPAEYKGTELDRAMAAWQSLSSKKVVIPENLIPKPPECKVFALECYIQSLEGVLKDLDKYKKLVNEYITCLKAVQGAGKKAASEIAQLAKAKGVTDEGRQRYAMAARGALNIADSAAAELKNYQ